MLFRRSNEVQLKQALAQANAPVRREADRSGVPVQMVRIIPID